MREFRAGSDLPTLRKKITQDYINLYAEASGDFNPIHVDEQFARESQFGTTIAHGMMIAASLSEMMITAFGKAWHKTGRLNIRFRRPVMQGDTIRTNGAVREIIEGLEEREVRCNVAVTRQSNEEVITGQAIVIISKE